MAIEMGYLAAAAFNWAGVLAGTSAYPVFLKTLVNFAQVPSTPLYGYEASVAIPFFSTY